MRKDMCRAAPFLLTLWLAIAPTAAPALGDQRDALLDGLFASLAKADHPRVAAPIENRIWALWIRHGRDETVDGLMRRGMALMDSGRLDDAYDMFDKVVARAPDFAEGWNKRATVAFLLGDYTASILDVERVLALEPRHFGALSGLGLIYMSIGEPAAALRAFEAVQAIHPAMPGLTERIERLREEVKGKPL